MDGLESIIMHQIVDDLAPRYPMLTAYISDNDRNLKMVFQSRTEPFYVLTAVIYVGAHATFSLEPARTGPTMLCLDFRATLADEGILPICTNNAWYLQQASNRIARYGKLAGIEMEIQQPTVEAMLEARETTTVSMNLHVAPLDDPRSLQALIFVLTMNLDSLIVKAYLAGQRAAHAI